LWTASSVEADYRSFLQCSKDRRIALACSGKKFLGNSCVLIVNWIIDKI